MAQNPIIAGYVWRQAFDFPTDFFQNGDMVRAEFRSQVADVVPVVSLTKNHGTYIEDDRVILELTPAQTKIMSTITSGKVVTALVVVRSGEEIPVGVIITIPIITEFPTRSSL